MGDIQSAPTQAPTTTGTVNAAGIVVATSALLALMLFGVIPYYGIVEWSWTPLHTMARIVQEAIVGVGPWLLAASTALIATAATMLSIVGFRESAPVSARKRRSIQTVINTFVGVSCVLSALPAWGLVAAPALSIITQVRRNESDHAALAEGDLAPLLDAATQNLVVGVASLMVLVCAQVLARGARVWTETDIALGRQEQTLLQERVRQEARTVAFARRRLLHCGNSRDSVTRIVRRTVRRTLLELGVAVVLMIGLSIVFEMIERGGDWAATFWQPVGVVLQWWPQLFPIWLLCVSTVRCVYWWGPNVSLKNGAMRISVAMQVAAITIAAAFATLLSLLLPIALIAGTAEAKTLPDFVMRALVLIVLFVPPLYSVFRRGRDSWEMVVVKISARESMRRLRAVRRDLDVLRAERTDSPSSFAMEPRPNSCCETSVGATDAPATNRGRPREPVFELAIRGWRFRLDSPRRLTMRASQRSGDKPDRHESDGQ